MAEPNIITSLPSSKNSLVSHSKKARVSKKLHRSRWNLAIGPQVGYANGARVHYIACRAVNELGLRIQYSEASWPCNKFEYCMKKSTILIS